MDFLSVPRARETDRSCEFRATLQRPGSSLIVAPARPSMKSISTRASAMRARASDSAEMRVAGSGFFFSRTGGSAQARRNSDGKQSTQHKRRTSPKAQGAIPGHECPLRNMPGEVRTNTIRPALRRSASAQLCHRRNPPYLKTQAFRIRDPRSCGSRLEQLTSRPPVL